MSRLRWLALIAFVLWPCASEADETRSFTGPTDCPGPGCPAKAPKEAPAPAASDSAGDREEKVFKPSARDQMPAEKAEKKSSKKSEKKAK